MARIKFREVRLGSSNENDGNRESTNSQSNSSRKVTPNMRNRSVTTPSIEKIDGALSPTPPPSFGGGKSNGPAAELMDTSINYTSTPASILTLPSLSNRDTRQMGGTLPKRSNLRVRHDASMDFRRVHHPEEIPRNFKMLLQQRLKTGEGSSSGRSDKAHHIHHPTRQAGVIISILRLPMD
jgi:hypothetical protein